VLTFTLNNVILIKLPLKRQPSPLKTEQKPSVKEIQGISSIIVSHNFGCAMSKSNFLTESLILAQDERWRRA
jgi:hypothetical protein